MYNAYVAVAILGGFMTINNNVKNQINEIYNQKGVIENYNNQSVFRKVFSRNPEINDLGKRINTLFSQISVINSNTQNDQNASALIRTITNQDIEHLKTVVSMFPGLDPETKQKLVQFESKYKDSAEWIAGDWHAYHPGDTQFDIKGKIAIQTDENNIAPPQFKDRVNELKLKYIESVLTEGNPRHEFIKNEIASSQNSLFASSLYDAIAHLEGAVTIEHKLDELADREKKYGGLTTILRNIDEFSAGQLDEEDLEALQEQFVNLSPGRSIEVIPFEKVPANQLLNIPVHGDAAEASSSSSAEEVTQVRSNLVLDMRRTNASVNFEKVHFPNQNPEKPGNIKEVARIRDELKDENFGKMTSIFHQGINASGLIALKGHYTAEGKVSHLETVDPGFQQHMLIFKNDKGETIYRYLSIVSVATEWEDDMPKFTDYHLHLIDCKKNPEDDGALVQRYISRSFSDPEGAKMHLAHLINGGIEGKSEPLGGGMEEKPLR